MSFDVPSLFHQFLVYGLICVTAFSYVVTIWGFLRWLRRKHPGAAIAWKPLRRPGDDGGHQPRRRLTRAPGSASQTLGIPGIRRHRSLFDDNSAGWAPLAPQNVGIGLNSSCSFDSPLIVNPASGLPCIGGIGSPDVAGNAWGSSGLD